MYAQLYILIFCTPMWCAPHALPYAYTLTREQCVEQAREVRRDYKNQTVHCRDEAGYESVESDGTSRYLRNEVR